MDSRELFKCDKCTKVFPSLGRFNQHLKTHTKPYSCNECDKSFALRADLSRHVRARHRTGQSMHACVVDQCPFKATRKDNIRQHLRINHPDYSSQPQLGKRKRQTANENLAIPRVVDASDDVQSNQRHIGLSTLMQAARTGSFVLVQTMLHLGIDVSIQADDGSTALHCAAQADQVEMVQYLLAAGAKAEIMNRRGRTSLHEAIFSRSLSAVAFLLRNGSNVSRMILDDMIKCNDSRLVGSVLDNLGDSLIDVHGEHLLKIAARSNSVASMAKLMSSTKIDRIWLFSWGRKAVCYAVKYERVAIVKCLLESNKLDPNFLTSPMEKISVLQLAASCGHLEIVKLLLACEEIDINQKDMQGHSPIHKAAARGHHKVVDILLQCEGIVVSHEETASPNRWRAKELHVAALGGYTAVFESILGYLDRKHVSIDQKDAYGRTSMDIAVVKGRIDIVKLLTLSQHIQYHRPGSHDGTWLDLAVQTGQLEILKLLLENNEIDFATDPEIRHSLLKQAALGLYWQIVGFLLEHQSLAPKYRSERIWDVGRAKRNTHLMEWILDEVPLSTNWVDSEGTSLLSKAVEGNDATITALILDHDISKVNYPNSNGSTPLHFAVRRPHALDSLQLLLDHRNVHVNKMDDFGMTAMHYAIICRNFEAAKLICQHRDFDVNTRKEYGSSYFTTALACARMHHYDQCVDLLLKCGAEDPESLGEVSLGAALEKASECENPQHLLDRGSQVKVSNTAGSISWNTNRAIQAMATGDEDMGNSTDFVTHEIGVHDYESGTDQEMVDGQDDGEEYWGPYGLSRSQKQKHVSWEL